jgi:hypothetical protein
MSSSDAGWCAAECKAAQQVQRSLLASLTCEMVSVSMKAVAYDSRNTASARATLRVASGAWDRWLSTCKQARAASNRQVGACGCQTGRQHIVAQKLHRAIKAQL